MSPVEFVQRGQALVERGQYQEAVKVCRLGLLAHPTHLDGRLLLGTCLLALRRHDEVLAEMRVALEIDGNNAEAMALRGEALLHKGDAHQAAEVLRKARAIDPGSRRIRNLLSEAESAAHDTGGATIDPLDSMTKHYPAHRGLGASGPGGSGGVTRPTSSLRSRGFTPAPGVLEVGDRSGTIEIDPELEGIEMLDDDLDDPIAEPPRASVDESEPIELASYDLIEDPNDELPLRANVGDGLTADEPTAHYRKQRLDDFSEESATIAAGKPRGRGADFHSGTGAGTSPETPMAKPVVGRARSEELAESAAAIVDMFDDESGVSKLTELPDGAPRNRSRSEDMRTIRAGLGMGGARKAGYDDVPAPLARKRPPAAAVPTVQQTRKRNEAFENTEHIKRPKKRKGWDPEEVSEERITKQQKKEAKRAAKASKKKKKRSGKVKRAARRRRAGGGRGRWIVYSVVLLAVAGGAVYGGLKIRELRLDKDIQAARDKAKKAAKSDGFLGLLEARRQYEKIVDARSSTGNRAALARMTARIAYQFGDVPLLAKNRDVTARAYAKELVVGLGKTDSADALAARAYVALAGEDPVAASKLGDELVRKHSDDPGGPYLAGSAALALGQHDVAEKHFRAALRLTQRPSVYVGLGAAQAGLNKQREAIEAFKFAEAAQPDHPAAVIAKGRVMAAMPSLLVAPAELDDKLDRIRKEAKLPPEQQKLGVSRRQGVWATLTLVQIKLARGKRKEARALLTETKSERLVDDWAYSQALSHLLMKLGMLRDARAEAARAKKRWPKRAEAAILIAEIALTQGEPKKALTALGDGKLDEPRALAARGRARLALNDLSGATKDLDAALTKRPDLRAAQVARADVDLRIGKPDEAVSRLAKIYSKDASPEAGVIYASALRQTRKIKLAREILRKLLAMPSPGRAYLELARLERDAGNFREARKAYGKAIEQQPDTILARLEAAVLALDTGDPTGAKEAVAGLLKDSPKNGAVLIEAARIYTINGDVPQAEKLIADAATEGGAPTWKLARERGRAFLRRRKARQAVGELEKAVEGRASDAESHMLLIDAYLTAEDKGSARKAKQDVLRRFRGQPEAQMAIGRVELFERREKEALSAFRKARSLYEKRKAPPRALAEVNYYLGQTQYYIGKLKQAVKLLKKAIALDPSHAYAYFFLGLIELERPGRARAAMNAMKKSLDRDPIGNPDAWFYLGDAAYKAKQWATSKRALRTYLKKMPSGELAREARTILSRFR